MSKPILILAVLSALGWSFVHAIWHHHQSDGYIRSQAVTRIDNDAVMVGVDKQWVTLDGMVESSQMKRQISERVKEVAGVHGVTNNLVVLNTLALANLQALMADPPSNAPFNYSIEPDGLIVLTGTVPDERMRQRIGDMVAAIEGVRRVDNQLVVQAVDAGKIETQIRDVLKLHKIYFEFDKATLRPESAPALDAIGEVLAAYPAAIVKIEGHTDWIGTDAYNMDLSHRRAAAVRAALLSRGIPAERMRSEGFGESMPVAPNTTSQGRAENRRIEFRVVNPG